MCGLELLSVLCTDRAHIHHVFFCVTGTTKIAHFEQNYAARDIHLTAEDLRRIDEVFSINAPVGERYGGNHFTFHEN
jgi:diketogulonate reductase-like aldo/keto reductase